MAARQVVSATEEANDTLRFHHRGFSSLPPACSTLTCQLHMPSPVSGVCVQPCVCLRSPLPLPRRAGRRWKHCESMMGAGERELGDTGSLKGAINTRLRAEVDRRGEGKSQEV
ncbi:unnamed protein product [Pleuronectes platessa]|uniref:Uncharacterized protein n=1 Tax=Pleuronectes platessa TaxID=8262 RepID=A0A9N7U8V8_PLEPL|nr:unnamed protein product [Pleuronectes platessa]